MNALPPPASFGHEHRPLRLTSESARPQPQGGCHFQPVPGQNQRCLCQSFQHNRSAPGNICDCGHSACYHSHFNNDRRLSPDRVVGALAEKVKKMEDALTKERETRDSLLARERQAWEREVRVLREALAPFYRSEQDMGRRLLEVEDRLDRTSDEYVRLQERLSAIDDASITFERRLENYEMAPSRKRKADNGLEGNGVMSPESNDASSFSDVTSISQRSPQPTSPMNDHLPASHCAAYQPRLNGVLNTTSAPRLVHDPSAYHSQHRQQMPSPEDEPRSSGFLSIDLAERVRRHKPSPPTMKGANLRVLPSINQALPSPPLASYGNAVTGALPVSGLLSNAFCKPVIGLESHSSKKRKQENGIMALDVLANVTVASPLAH